MMARSPLPLNLDTPLERFKDGLSRSPRQSGDGHPAILASAEVSDMRVALGTIPNYFVGDCYAPPALFLFSKLSCAESQQA